jgi:hypothetical protein
VSLLLMVAALGTGSWAWAYVIANRHDDIAAAAVVSGQALLFNVTVAVPVLASNQGCSRWFGSSHVSNARQLFLAVFITLRPYGAAEVLQYERRTNSKLRTNRARNHTRYVPCSHWTGSCCCHPDSGQILNTCNTCQLASVPLCCEHSPALYCSCLLRITRPHYTRQPLKHACH